MRTTLDLPEDLISEAMKVSKKPTKTAVIITALEDLVRKSKIQDIKNFNGTIELDADLDALRNRR
jgi:hypothetical protein